MFGLSYAHILILMVVLLLFGGKRLPEIGQALGKGLRSFRKGLEGIEDLAPQESHSSESEVKIADEILSAADKVAGNDGASAKSSGKKSGAGSAGNDSSKKQS